MSLISRNHGCVSQWAVLLKYRYSTEYYLKYHPIEISWIRGEISWMSQLFSIKSNEIKWRAKAFLGCDSSVANNGAVHDVWMGNNKAEGCTNGMSWVLRSSYDVLLSACNATRNKHTLCMCIYAVMQHKERKSTRKHHENEETDTCSLNHMYFIRNYTEHASYILSRLFSSSFSVHMS